MFRWKFVKPSVKFDKESLARFQKALRKAGAEIDDLRIPLGQIAKEFLESRKFIFGAKGPGQYKDLSPGYKAWKRKHSKKKSPYPILFLTGRLAKSITSKSGENITIVDKKSLTIGSSVEYAPFHQYGQGVPVREFLFWGPESPKFATHKAVLRQNKGMAITLFEFIERKMGKTLDAARTKAERKTDALFK